MLAPWLCARAARRGADRLRGLSPLGGEEEATEFCGLQIVRDWNARTITLTQEAFARKMLAKYDVSGRAEATPLKVSKSKLEPYTGEPCEETSFDYSMALGDLAWYARTNPGLSVAVHKLAQFMQRPGPDHIEAVHHVLRYVQGNLGAGLTYHRSDGCGVEMRLSSGLTGRRRTRRGRCPRLEGHP